MDHDLTPRTRAILSEMGVTDEILDAHRKRHPDRLVLLRLDVDDQEQCVLIREPGRAELQAYGADIQRDSLKANHNLLEACLLAPDWARLQALTAKYPGLLLAFGNKLLTLAKVTTEIRDTRI